MGYNEHDFQKHCINILVKSGYEIVPSKGFYTNTYINPEIYLRFIAKAEYKDYMHVIESYFPGLKDLVQSKLIDSKKQLNEVKVDYGTSTEDIVKLAQETRNELAEALLKQRRKDRRQEVEAENAKIRKKYEEELREYNKKLFKAFGKKPELSLIEDDSNLIQLSASDISKIDLQVREEVAKKREQLRRLAEQEAFALRNNQINEMKHATLGELEDVFTANTISQIVNKYGYTPNGEVSSSTILTQLYNDVSNEINKVIRDKGLIQSLKTTLFKKNITICGRDFPLLCRQPDIIDGTISSINQLKGYESNILGVTDEFVYNPANKNRIDIVLSINGIPLIAMELKSEFSGQSLSDAEKQWKFKRDSSDKFFKYNNRILAYFCVSETRASMTTRLNGGKTIFLPFNQGVVDNTDDKVTGAGNAGSTDYIFTDVFSKETFLKLITHFICYKDNVSKSMEANDPSNISIIFPRYHQLEVVTNICKDIKGKIKDGRSQQNYLINHSAGSGKTQSIIWLAYQLDQLYDKADKVFKKVFIISDRKQIVGQLSQAAREYQNTVGITDLITTIENTNNKGMKLAEAIEGKSRIIVITIQSFRDLQAKLKEINSRDGSRFAILIDEAHSSQGGKLTDEIYKALTGNVLGGKSSGAEDLEDDYDTAEVSKKLTNAESEILRSKLEEAAKSGQLQMFAFTATPVTETFSIFGNVETNKETLERKYRAFHTYSMRQAIEEEYILNVLSKFISEVRPIEIEAEHEYANKKSNLKRNEIANLMDKIRLSKDELEYKVNTIVDHFIDNVYLSLPMHYEYDDINGRLGETDIGTGKAMVITSSRLEAYLLYLGIRDEISKRAEKDSRYKEFKALVSFTGDLEFTKERIDMLTSIGSLPDGVTEGFKVDTKSILEKDTGINKLGDPNKLKGTFHRYEYAVDHKQEEYRYAYRILVVANQFQTGFDEPFLNAMYISKKLHDVSIVQTLSRLNRCNKSFNKSEVYVVDFSNSWDDIQNGFKAYLGAMSKIDNSPDIITVKSRVEQLKKVLHDSELLDSQVFKTYYQSECDFITVRLECASFIQKLKSIDKLATIQQVINRCIHEYKKIGLIVQKLSQMNSQIDTSEKQLIEMVKLHSDDALKSDISLLEQLSNALRKRATELEHNEELQMDLININANYSAAFEKEYSLIGLGGQSNSSMSILGEMTPKVKQEKTIGEIIAAINQRLTRTYAECVTKDEKIELTEEVNTVIDDIIEDMLHNNHIRKEVISKKKQRNREVERVINIMNEDGFNIDGLLSLVKNGKAKTEMRKSFDRLVTENIIVTDKDGNKQICKVGGENRKIHELLSAAIYLEILDSDVINTSTGQIEW